MEFMTPDQYVPRGIGALAKPESPFPRRGQLPAVGWHHTPESVFGALRSRRDRTPPADSIGQDFQDHHYLETSRELSFGIWRSSHVVYFDEL